MKVSREGVGADESTAAPAVMCSDVEWQLQCSVSSGGGAVDAVLVESKRRAKRVDGSRVDRVVGERDREEREERQSEGLCVPPPQPPTAFNVNFCDRNPLLCRISCDLKQFVCFSSSTSSPFSSSSSSSFIPLLPLTITTTAQLISHHLLSLTSILSFVFALLKRGSLVVRDTCGSSSALNQPNCTSLATLLALLCCAPVVIPPLLRIPSL